MGGVRVRRDPSATNFMETKPSDLLARSIHTDLDSLLSLVPLDAETLPKNADIDERSKSTLLTKGIALSQLAWFVLNTISRLSEGLPVSLIEVETVSNVFLSTLAFAAWLQNPYGVTKAIIVTANRSVLESAKDLPLDRNETFSEHENRWAITAIIHEVPTTTTLMIMLTFSGLRAFTLPHGIMPFQQWQRCGSRGHAALPCSFSLV
jgi:hypothetical protein